MLVYLQYDGAGAQGLVLDEQGVVKLPMQQDGSAEVIGLAYVPSRHRYCDTVRRESDNGLGIREDGIESGTTQPVSELAHIHDVDYAGILGLMLDQNMFRVKIDTQVI